MRVKRGLYETLDAIFHMSYVLCTSLTERILREVSGYGVAGCIPAVFPVGVSFLSMVMMHPRIVCLSVNLVQANMPTCQSKV